MGRGAAKRLSAVRWGVAGNIVVAWVLTLPCSAAIGAAAYGATRIFGTGALGPGRRLAVRRDVDRGRVRAARAASATRGLGGGDVIAAVAIGDLVELVWVSLAATIVLSLAASLCVLGLTRSNELRRARQGGAAAAYAALGLAGALGRRGRHRRGARRSSSRADRLAGGKQAGELGPAAGIGLQARVDRVRQHGRQAACRLRTGSARRCSTGSSVSPSSHCRTRVSRSPPPTGRRRGPTRPRPGRRDRRRPARAPGSTRSRAPAARGPGGRAMREVDELGPAAVGDDVGRLEVEVQQALAVQVADGASTRWRPRWPSSAADSRRARRARRCASVSPPQRLEDDRRRRLLQHLVRPDEMRVGQPAQQASLTAQRARRGGVRAAVRPQRLDHHGAAALVRPGGVDVEDVGARQALAEVVAGGTSCGHRLEHAAGANLDDPVGPRQHVGVVGDDDRRAARRQAPQRFAQRLLGGRDRARSSARRARAPADRG